MIMCIENKGVMVVITFQSRRRSFGSKPLPFSFLILSLEHRKFVYPKYGIMGGLATILSL